MPLATNFLLFEDYVDKTWIPTNPIYSPTEFNEQLGLHDQLCLHAILDNMTDSFGVGLNFFVEHSSDGVHWISRTGTTPQIWLLPNLANLVQSMWSDAGLAATSSDPTITGPLLHFVRVKMYWDSADGGAHVRLYATQRDLHAQGRPQGR